MPAPMSAIHFNFLAFFSSFFFVYFQRRKFDGLDYGLDHHQLTAEQLQQLQDETDPMDWQTAALFLAVLACLLFFIVAACILVHHMRQWRRMERRLDQGKITKRTSVRPSVLLSSSNIL